MNKPEQLFPGVEWEWRELADCWTVEIDGATHAIEQLKTGEWWPVFAIDLDQNRWVHCGCATPQAQAIAWLRARIIEHRDELCRVTSGRFEADGSCSAKVTVEER